MTRTNNKIRRRELAKKSGESLSEGLITGPLLIDGHHRFYALQDAAQKKRQATKFVARLDNPRQTNVSDMRSL